MNIRRYAWVIELLAASVVVLLVLYTINHTVIKRDNLGYSSLSRTLPDYYAQPADSVDVLLLGTSKTMSGLMPSILWHEYGISSHLLAGTGQAPLLSYYLLEEALKSQHPKAVVVEGNMLLRINNLDYLDEAYYATIDHIPLSLTKIKLALEMWSYAEYASPEVTLLPFIRYHQRWLKLTKTDFVLDPIYRRSLHGAWLWPARRVQLAEGYMAIDDGGAAIVDFAGIYMQRIADLCAHEGIQLVIVNMPDQNWSTSRSDLTMAWGQERGVPVIELNDSDNMAELVLEPGVDLFDPSHLSKEGAVKATRIVGRFLRDAGVPDRRGTALEAEWNLDYDFYEAYRRVVDLRDTTDPGTWLQFVNNPDYTVLIVSRLDMTEALVGDVPWLLSQLGVKANLTATPTWSYIGIVRGGQTIYEQFEDEPITYDTDLADGRHVRISSNTDEPNPSIVLMDGIHQGGGQQGITFVVYSHQMRSVVDVITLNSSPPRHFIR